MTSNKFSNSTLISIAALGVSAAAIVYSMGNHGAASHASIGFIDFQAVLQQSDAGKSIRDVVEPRRAKLQAAAEAKLKELKQEQEDLKKQGDSAEAAAALQKKVDAWNAEAQRKQAVLDAAVNPAMQKIDEALRTQVEAIADENKVSAILPMQSAFYANKSLDMTSDAIRRLNKILPKLDVKLDDDK